MLKMNHIGIVVKSIQKYLKYSPYHSLLKHTLDDIQNSYMGLIETKGDEPNIELIEPINEQATTFNFLKNKGGGVHHFCYEIGNIDKLKIFLQSNNIKRFYGPTQARLFDDKAVVFGYTKNREIIEFIITDGL